MSYIVPPYLNKNITNLEKELSRAEQAEAKAKANYETAKEYTELCRKALEDAKKQS